MKPINHSTGLKDEIEEYKKACTTLSEISELFRYADTNSLANAGFAPYIRLHKTNSLPRVYIFSVENTLVGYVKVEAVFDIDERYLNVHELAKNKGVHDYIRENLAYFLSVFHNQEYIIKEL